MPTAIGDFEQGCTVSNIAFFCDNNRYSHGGGYAFSHLGWGEQSRRVYARNSPPFGQKPVPTLRELKSKIARS